MSGTSCDGVDVALVRIHGHGLSMRAELLHLVEQSFSDIQLADGRDLATATRALANGAAATAAEFCGLAQHLAQAHITALAQLPQQSQKPQLIAVHGQTIFHAGCQQSSATAASPNLAAPSGTWQIIDLPAIAYATGIPVVGDLRAPDIAVGQGALITPLADRQLYQVSQNVSTATVVLNLGGFINWTFLPENMQVDDIRGADLCACNQVLDMIARHYDVGAYDAGGAVAATGSVIEAVRNHWQQWFAAQAQAAASWRKFRNGACTAGDGVSCYLSGYQRRRLSGQRYRRPGRNRGGDSIAQRLARNQALIHLHHRTKKKQWRARSMSLVLAVLCAGGGVRNQALIEGALMDRN